MRRLLALAVLVAFLPTANAQDKAKTDFSLGAEYRARYFWMQNPGGNEDAYGQDSFVEHRMKTGLSFKASEKMSAHMTLIHAADFGSTNAPFNTNSADVNTHHDNNNQENFLNVNEAYANWMVSDDLSFRFGRQNYQIGDGYVMSVNDWEQNPFAFDGLVGNWEAEFGRFQFFAFKYRELDAARPATTSASKDPEHNAYGLNFDLKTTPEWLKAVNVHVIKDNADATTAVDGVDTLRYGAHGAFAFGPMDLKAWYAAHTGKTKDITAGVVETDTKGMMYQLEAGFNMDAFMGSRFFANYHVDSGDDNATDNENGDYNAYFTEQHEAAGLMDILAWGNLTSIQIGWTLKPSDSTTAGLSYYMFSRTEDAGTTQFGRFGGAFAAGDATKDKLGDEIDLWAEHRYDGGLSTLLRLGYFTPGDYFDSAALASRMGDNVLHVAVEAKMTF